MKLKPPSASPRVFDADLLRRFAGKISVDGSGCWLWTGYTDGKGYGQIKYQGKARWAHRISYAMFVGEIPNGLTVEHTCNVAGCVNPAHFILLTRGENTAEANRRRASNGQEVPF